VYVYIGNGNWRRFNLQRIHEVGAGIARRESEALVVGQEVES